MNLTMAKPRLWERWKEAEQLALLATFEDADTCNRVKEFCQGLARDLDGRCKIIQHVWVASTFRLRELREIAAEEACAADLIVISAHQAESVPDEVRSWFELWVLQKRSRAAVLLALLDAGYGGTSGSMRAYLHEVARRGNMEFLVESEPGS